MKTYVTFGFDHVHAISGRTFDRNSVAVIDCNNAEEGRNLAFEFFGNKWCMEYPDYEFDIDEKMKFYPRGLIPVN